MRNVLSVRDRKLGEYLQPFFVPSVPVGVRAFGDACLDSNSPLAAHPEDYELFEIAVWDELTGAFTNLVAPKSLALGDDFVKGK